MRRLGKVRRREECWDESHPPHRDCAIPPLSWRIILNTVVIRFVLLSLGNRWQVAARAYFGFLIAYMRHVTKAIFLTKRAKRQCRIGE
jgi:hypothetical protein